MADDKEKSRADKRYQGKPGKGTEKPEAAPAKKAEATASGKGAPSAETKGKVEGTEPSPQANAEQGANVKKVTDRHKQERAELVKRHDTERTQMHGRHETDHHTMHTRHAKELAEAPGEAKAEGKAAADAGGGQRYKTKDEGKSGTEPK